MDEPIDIGADVCVAHVDDKTATKGPQQATNLAKSSIQEGLTALETKWRRSGSRWPEPVVKYKSHATQELPQRHCSPGSRLVDGRPWWPKHPNLLPIAKDDAADEHHQLVADEAMVFGAMAMSRNVLGGAVHRQVGVFDLMAVSVQRLSVCADQWCQSVVAVDTTRPSEPITHCANNSMADAGGGVGNGSSSVLAGCSTATVPIITQVGPDGVERPVHMANSELLSLGRGMLGSPHWFSLAPTPFHLGGQLSLTGPTLLVPKASKTGIQSIQDGEETTKWDLNGSVSSDPIPDTSDSLPATPTSTPFLAHLAALLCAGRLRSFVAASSACDSIRPWGRVRRASGPSEFQGNIMDAGVWAGAGKVDWKIAPTRLTPVAAGDAPEKRHSLPYLRPAWTLKEVPIDTAQAQGGFMPTSIHVTSPKLVGRASREINPSSAVEAELAASLFQRPLLVPAADVARHASSTSSRLEEVSPYSGANNELALELDRLAHGYDRRVFQEEHPAPPVSPADMILAIIVVVPELGALLVLMLTTERWGRAALLGFFSIVVLGAVSISGVIALAAQEAVGAAWRARSTRTATHAIFPAGNPVDEWGAPNMFGTLVVVDESLLVLAPTMYRPLWVQRVAAAVCGAYVVAAAVMSARVLFVARQQRRVHRAVVETPLPGAGNEALPLGQWFWQPPVPDSARGAEEGRGTENESGGDGGTAAEAAWRGSEVETVFSGVGAPPCPLFTGGLPWPPQWRGNGRNEQV